MHLFVAAAFTNHYMPGQRHYAKLLDNEKAIAENLNTKGHILESFHYVQRQSYVDEMRNANAQIFLDSGAFSAYTLGKKINIQTYCDYIKRNEDIIRKEDGVLMASVLDSIGDDLGTFRNQKTMEALGVTPLPCFHAGEDDKYLEYYVANYEYITLGGLVGSSSAALITWLDRVWEKMIDDTGRPRCKVHGFGITAIPIMERYPWYSCDSSSWIQATSFGSIYMPKIGPMSISNKSPSRHDYGQHIDSMPPLQKEHLLNIIKEQGFDYNRLSTEYVSRAAYNIQAFMDMNVLMNEQNDYTRFNKTTQELY